MDKSQKPTWETELNATMQVNQKPGSIIGQLATIRATATKRSGRPTCRTVNIRKLEDTRLYFVSDTRSAKAIEVTSGDHPFAELCVFDAASRVQFRLSGVMTVLPDCDMSRAFWAQLTPPERAWWSWPTPAASRAADALFHTPVPIDPPSHFCVCCLTPDFVEVLYLAEHPFRRIFHELAEEDAQQHALTWTSSPVNP